MKNQYDNNHGYILKGQLVFVGLEDSKRTWKICVRSGGIVVNEASMPAKYDVLHNYLRNRFPECKITVMYEAGFRGFDLHDKLRADGWECVVTPPHTVMQEKCQRQKNDRIDCRRLAKNLERNDYKICHVFDKQQREDRQISRMYEQNQKDITRVCNRIRRTLEFHGLDSHFDPGAWRKRDYITARERLEGMEISSSLWFSLQTYFDTLEKLWQLKKEILKKLSELAKTERYQKNVEIVKSAPGIGKLTAIRLVLELGDMTRFKRKEEFGSFIGLIPSDYSTGETDRKGHITKQGNHALRGWLIESSWVAIKYDPVLLDKYQRVFKNCNSKKKAIVAVAKKLAMRIRTMLITQQPYIIGQVR
jgi:transposase